jgi:hypothetical protein
MYRYQVRRFDLAAYRVMPKRPAMAGAIPMTPESAA